MISIDVNSVLFDGVEVDGECTCLITIESVERSHFNNCSFDFRSGATMAISGSKIDFSGSQLSTAIQLTNAALSWTGGSLSSELRCLNCCFTGLEPDSSYPYLSLTGTGIANFTDTCFDQAKETCVVISSSVSFVSENDESVMFGNCVCSQPLPPPLSTNTDEEPSPSEFISSESAEEADPSEFTSLESAEESSPSEFIMSESEELSVEQPEKPDDSGTKGNNNAGLIAGAVIAVLAAVGATAAVVFVIIWYRNHTNNAKFSSSTEDGPETANHTDEPVEEEMPWGAPDDDLAMWL